MKKQLIIDGNNLLHRAYHKFKNMKSKEGQNTSILFGFPFILKSLIDLNKPSGVLVVFDGGRSKIREEVLPDYKKREKKPDFDYDDFTFQKEELKKLLTHLCIPHTEIPGNEADDIIWYYARNFKRKGEHSFIVSTDKDFNQILSKNVSIWHPWKNKRITHKNVELIYGYTPEQCVDYLILDGDKSDHIPGYPGVGPKTALKFINNYGSIKEYLYTEGVKEDKKIKKKELEKLFLQNRIVIDLRLYLRRYMDKSIIKIHHPAKAEINVPEIRYYESKYNITSFNNKRFITAFQKLLN